MSTTKTMTDPAEMGFLTEAPALQACPAPAIAKPGIAALLMKWIGYECQGWAEQTTTLAAANDVGEEDWEKWLHGCGRGVR
jgi:hypothetical protein